MKPFNSYLSAGLLITALAAAVFVKSGWLAFPVLGLTCGIATRSVRLTLTGLITSAGLGFIICALVPVYTSPPQPPGLAHFGSTYIAAVFGASVGAALLLPHRRLVITAIIGCAFSLLALVCLSFLLRIFFPEALRVLEVWEYITIVLAVPLIGLGTWWPVDLTNRRLQSAPASDRTSHCIPAMDADTRGVRASSR
jgi:hypothetical protein